MVLFNPRIASFILRTGNYQQIFNEIMTNPGAKKTRDHITTIIFFNLINCMANLLGWGGVTWKNGSLLHRF